MAQKEEKDPLEKEKEVAKGLVGKTVTLSPKEAFFVEPNGKYLLNAYGGKESVVIEEGWKLQPTMEGVKLGLLRVLDSKGNDVSEKFGGPQYAPTRHKPLVDKGIAHVDGEGTDMDKRIREMLNQTNVEIVIKHISDKNPPYAWLERMRELELAGENPMFRARGSVMDHIEALMKKAVVPGGELVARKLDETEEKITTTRK